MASKTSVKMKYKDEQFASAKKSVNAEASERVASLVDCPKFHNRLDIIQVGGENIIEHLIRTRNYSFVSRDLPHIMQH